MNCKEGKPPNAAGLMTTNPYNFENIKAYFIKKGKHIPRFQTKIIQLWGKHYFRNLTEEEWKIQQDLQFVKVENIDTKKELETFIAEVMMKDMKRLPFVFYFIPDYDETSGRFVLVMNHSYSDAAGIFPILIAMTEE